MKKEIATFAAGCFWGVEYKFSKVSGVLQATSGYMGGELVNPTYEAVCTDQTGHAEVVEVQFDSEKVSFEQLLEIFWKLHDPTQLNRQGPDEGSQYRSAIFYYTEEQKRLAEESKKKQKRDKPVVTEIVPAATFWRAEEYHQKYMAKHPEVLCHIGE